MLREDFSMKPTGLQIETQAGMTIYTLHDISRETLDAWGDHFIKLIQHTPEGHPYYVLMDTSRQELSFSPYFRSRAQMLIDAQGHRHGYLAIVIDNSLIQQVVSFYMRLQRTKAFESKVVTTYDAAWTWLVNAHKQTA
jgi:hypothetical protein